MLVAFLIYAVIFAVRLEAFASLELVGALPPVAGGGAPCARDRILAPHRTDRGSLRATDGDRIKTERPTTLMTMMDVSELVAR